MSEESTGEESEATARAVAKLFHMGNFTKGAGELGGRPTVFFRAEWHDDYAHGTGFDHEQAAQTFVKNVVAAESYRETAEPGG